MFKTKAGASNTQKEKDEQNTAEENSGGKLKRSKNDIVRDKSHSTPNREGQASSRASEFEINQEHSPWKDVKLKKTQPVDKGGEINRILSEEEEIQEGATKDSSSKPKKSGFWLFDKIRGVFSRKPKNKAPETEQKFERSTGARDSTRSWWWRSWRKSKGKGKLKTSDKSKDNDVSLDTRRKQAFSPNTRKVLESTKDTKETVQDQSQSGTPPTPKFTVSTSVVIEKPDLAPEAKAGLETSIDFSGAAANLRKVDTSPGAKLPADASRHDPFQHVMLLHVKGRRHVQVRLVCPSSVSVNSGDCFILVTPNTCLQWIGTSANAFEKSKTANVVSAIVEKKDLGYKSRAPPGVVEEKTQHLKDGRQFWEALNGEPPAQEAGDEKEDELHELYMTELNKVYQVSADSLQVIEDYCGNQPSYHMLNSTQVFVFDFGSEMYVWVGKKVPYEKQKLSIRLAKELWDKGYDYRKCDINPLCPFASKKNAFALKGGNRPDWALFAKVRQGSETVLFKEKFPDWPGKPGVIRAKSPEAFNVVKTDMTELKPCDVKKMLKVDSSPVTLKLDDSNIGRGDTWVEMCQDLRREFVIHTQSLEIWHMELDPDKQEFNKFMLDKPSHGQFHSGDAYVVRWQYLRLQKGMKSLEGGSSNRPMTTGRERVAYFYWQGQHSGIMDKGAAAVSTIELDEEGAPQIRVQQGKEPPCFVRLFEGSMAIHTGKRKQINKMKSSRWRCYVVRNELDQEAYLLEVEAHTRVLRSRSSFLLLNVKTGSLIVWHGCKSSESTRARAEDIANNFQESVPEEFELKTRLGVNISELEEGQETAEFWRALDSKTNNRQDYISLLNEENNLYDFTPRLFYMSSMSGEFVAKEIENVVRHSDVWSPFPFIQSDLYKASQPALCLVDNQSVVYLWQGWWPEEMQHNVRTGHASAVFNEQRRCACKTAINYSQEKYPTHPPPTSLVFAGMEPAEFTNLFPEWEVEQDVVDISSREGKSPGTTVPVEEFLEQLMRMHYSMEELQQRPLPEGVDPLKLESYLDDTEFLEILEMPREEFNKLPEWKKNEKKKQKNLVV